MRFYLGTHKPNWLWRLDVPLFVSRRALATRRTPFPPASTSWVLDSGGFTELHLAGAWSITPTAYAAEVARYRDELGRLDWVAPMDYMCEPNIVRRTGLSVREHQRRTVANFLELRGLLGDLVVPVLQGWEVGDYLRNVDDYAAAGVDLAAERIVGVGSVCRRGQDREISAILRELDGLRLHGFGVRGSALALNADRLASADSLAWSYRARKDHPLAGCRHARCNNCPRYALRWRDRVLAGVAPRLFDREGNPA